MYCRYVAFIYCDELQNLQFNRLMNAHYKTHRIHGSNVSYAYYGLVNSLQTNDCSSYSFIVTLDAIKMMNYSKRI